MPNQLHGIVISKSCGYYIAMWSLVNILFVGHTWVKFIEYEVSEPYF